MQLIGQYDSPFVRRVGIALMLYDMKFEHLPWSVMADWQSFVGHNPLRRVPTLVLEDGEALIDSGAIIDHLDEMAGREEALIATSGPRRRTALKRIALATGLGDKAVAYFYMRTFAKGVDPVFALRSESQIRDGLDAMEQACAEKRGDWWHGEGPGHDDIAVACVARFVREAYADLLGKASWPALSAHCKRAEALPAFKAIQQAFAPPR